MKREESDIVSNDIYKVNEILKQEFATNSISEHYRANNRIYVPPITSIDNALQIYYTYSEIGNREIKVLFGKLSSATISRLKTVVKREMDKRNLLSYGMYKVNTNIAFAIWGIHVADLEKRRKKLKDLNL